MSFILKGHCQKLQAVSFCFVSFVGCKNECFSSGSGSSEYGSHRMKVITDSPRSESLGLRNHPS